MTKNIKQLAVIGLAAIPGALLAEPVMVAGWDFSQFTTGAFNSIGDTLGSGGDFSQAGKLKSNYSGLLEGSAAGGPLAQDFGTVFYDGTNGSTSAGNLDSSGGDSIFPFAQNLGSVADLIDPPFGSNASENLLIFNGQTIYNDFGLRIDEDHNIVIEAQAGSPANGWTVNLAHQTITGTPGGQGLGFYYKEPGSGAFVEFASQTVSENDTGFTQSIPQMDGESTVQIQIRLTGVSSANAVMIDNVSLFAEFGAAGGESFWSASPQTGGWRSSREGYPDEVGIGWINDANWPYVYTYAMDDYTDGDWIYIVEANGSRDSFWGYNLEGGYWFYGNGAVGTYSIVGDPGIYFFKIL